MALLYFSFFLVMIAEYMRVDTRMKSDVSDMGISVSELVPSLRASSAIVVIVRWHSEKSTTCEEVYTFTQKRYNKFGPRKCSRVLSVCSDV